jgi:hypothetical protein
MYTATSCQPGELTVHAALAVQVLVGAGDDIGPSGGPDEALVGVEDLSGAER